MSTFKFLQFNMILTIPNKINQIKFGDLQIQKEKKKNQKIMKGKNQKNIFKLFELIVNYNFYIKILYHRRKY